MKRLTFGLAVLLIALGACARGVSSTPPPAPEDSREVIPGVEVLERSGFECLRGKKVGLLTNPSGIDRNLRSTVDILFAAPDVALKVLFAPEHGVRGDV